MALTKMGDELVFVGTRAEYQLAFGATRGRDFEGGDDWIVLFVSDGATQAERLAAYEQAARMVEVKR